MSNIMYSVCILTFNRQEQLPMTLSHLQQELVGLDIEVIILNNGSTDDTSAILSKIAENWKTLIILDSNENVGCALGREILWRQAKGKFIVSMDDDILISRSGMIDMLNLLETTNNAGIISPTIVDSMSKRVLNPATKKYSNATSFYEACFAISRELIDKVGYFDPALFVAGEGLDYSIRLYREGFKIVRVAGITVDHVDRVRTNIHEETRRIKWMWSFSYLYFKNHGLPLALLKAIRIVISHIRTGVPLFGWNFGKKILQAALRGAWSGRVAAGSITLSNKEPVS